jgi:hypothetical protein
MNDSWVKDAPKRINPIVVGSTCEIGDTKSPAVSMAFHGLRPFDTISVTLIGTEFDLRKFQKDIDRAITAALRDVRGLRP